MATATVEERLARLEAGYEHLATTSDLAEMEARLLAAILNGQSETNQRIESVNQRIDGFSIASNTRVDWVFWAVFGVGGGLLAAAVAALIRSAI